MSAARLLALLCLAVTAAAQTGPAEYLTTADGLSHDDVNAVAVAPNGAVWVGTSDGLDRVIGRDVRSWRTRRGADGLGSTHIRSLAVAPDGTVWAGTLTGGLVALDPHTGRVRRFTAADAGLPSDYVSSVTVAADGAVWVVCDRATLARLDPETRRVTTHRRATDGTSMYLILPDGDGVLLNDAAGVRQVGPTAQRVVWRPAAAGCPDAHVSWFTRRPSGALVAAALCAPGSDRFYLFEEGRERRALGSDFSRLAADPVGRLWVLTSSGLAVEPRPGAPPVRVLDGPVHQVVWGADRSAWIAAEGGLIRLRPAPPPLTTVDAVAGESVNAIAATADAVWFGWDRGLTRLDRATGRARAVSFPQPGTRVWSLLEAPDGVWVGTRDRGLWRARGGRLQSVPLRDLTIDTPSIRAIDRHAGALWLSLQYSLLRLPQDRARGDLFMPADPATLPLVASPDARVVPTLPGTPVNHVLRRRSGEVLVASDVGLHRLPPDSSAVPVLDRQIVWSAFEDDRERLWIGTVGDGLWLAEPGQPARRVLDEATGLLSDDVLGVLPETRGDAVRALWLSTPRGLVRYALADGVTATYPADELGIGALNLMAHHRAADGTLWVGGTKGALRFHPDSLRAAEAVPPPVVSAVEVGGAVLPGTPRPGDVLRLTPSQRTLAVRLARPDGRGRARVRLVGADSTWQTGREGVVRAAYTDLRPGQYTLVAEALHRDGRPAATTRITLDVVPRWWERRLVHGLAFLLVVGVAAALGRGQGRRRERREREQRRRLAQRLTAGREAERARLARDLHDGPLQSVYALGHAVDEAADTGDAAHLTRAREAAVTVAGDLRAAVGALRPPLLDHFGPAEALRAHAERLASAPDAPTITVTDDLGRRLAPDAEHALFRVGQEALSNAVRHARARTVALHIAPDGDGVSLSVTDDGVGFRVADLGRLLRDGHFGLAGARERAHALGGTLEVTSTPGGGTHLEVRLPAASADPGRAEASV